MKHRHTRSLASAGRTAISIALRLVSALTLALVPGCFERQLEPVAPCTRSRVSDTVPVEGVDEVDLLFMIDDSGSMAEEQQSIIDEIPRFVRILTTGDRDEDGEPDFIPARSLHVAIVGSDMGTGYVDDVDSCSAGGGDDGVFQDGAGACSASPSPPIFTFEEGGDTDAFARAIGCVAELGTGGCGFEQQLDAALKAVSLAPGPNGESPVNWTAPGYVPPPFASGTWGHAGPGGLNDGFLRPNSALAVILVTDEDDCSTPDPGIFDPDSTQYPGDLNLRCHTYTERLHDVQRYVDGLIGLRRSPSLVVFGAITGIPIEAEVLPPEEILDLDIMNERPDPSDTGHLLPVCSSPNGVAYPARRIVEVARGLERAGAGITVRSICNETFTGAVDAIIERLFNALSAGSCLPRELNPDADGRVPCEVYQVLPPIGSGAEAEHCADLAGGEGAFTLDGEEVSTERGVPVHRERCLVRQVARSEAGTVAGWFYDDGTSAASDLPPGCAQRISFSAARAVSRAEIRLVCDQTILPSTAEPDPQLGSFCDPETGAVLGGQQCSDGIATPGFTESTLSCDPFDRTCQIRCMSDSDCAAAGLLAYVCDRRTASEALGESLPTGVAGDLPHLFCVNPTCRGE